MADDFSDMLFNTATASSTGPTYDTESNPVQALFSGSSANDQNPSSFVDQIPVAASSPATPSDPANTYRTGSLALTAAGGLSKAYAQYESGHANAAIDRYNAQLDWIQATQAIEKGKEEANIQEEKGKILTGSQRGAQAGGGVIAGAGTGGAVIVSSAATIAQNEMMTTLNAQRVAFGFEARASIDETEANVAEKSSNAAAIGTLITTASQENLYADPNYRQRSSGFGGGT